MTVDVGLGATLDSIKYHLKGKVISTDNLQQDLQDGNDNDGEQQNESGGAQLIRLSKKDRESYQFSKYNIYITGVSLKIRMPYLSMRMPYMRKRRMRKSRILFIL